MSAGWITMDKKAEGGPKLFRKVSQYFIFISFLRNVVCSYHENIMKDVRPLWSTKSCLNSMSCFAPLGEKCPFNCSDKWWIFFFHQYSFYVEGRVNWRSRTKIPSSAATTKNGWHLRTAEKRIQKQKTDCWSVRIFKLFY